MLDPDKIISGWDIFLFVEKWSCGVRPGDDGWSPDDQKVYQWLVENDVIPIETHVKRNFRERQGE